MTDYHITFTDGDRINSLVCTSALGPDEFADFVYNTIITDPESKTVAHVTYIDCDGRNQSFEVSLN